MQQEIDLNGLIVFLGAALVAGGIACFLAMMLARGFAKMITKVNYIKLCISVIVMITLLVIYFSSWIGLLVLIVSTAVGIIPAIMNVKRSHAMGVLLQRNILRNI